MKKLLLLLSALTLTFGCYDDSDIRSELREHEVRLTTLETLCQQANSNIEALQTAVSALEKNVYVSAIIPVKKNGEVIGYVISFTNAETITIYHGQDGDKGEQGEKGNDGATPAVGLKQDADGTYYWTLNGEWLLDDSGKKVPASGKDGTDGLPGASGPQGAAGKDGITPRLKIEEGYWYVSYDGGKTWEDEPLGAAGVSDAEPIFTEVTYDTDYVYLTLADGEKLTLPRKTGETGGESTNPATVTIAEITTTTATFTGHLDVPASDLPFSKVTIYYSDVAAFNVNTAEKVSMTTFDENQNFTIVVAGLDSGITYRYCLMTKVKSDEYYSSVFEFITEKVSPPVSEEVAVNSSSILGDWEITNRVWEYIEDGKVTDAEDDPLSGADEGKYVFTLASDGLCVLKYNDNVRSTSRWTLTGKKIVFAETMPEPDMSYDCEIKSMTATTMELVYYMEVGEDYADTMRLVCRRL